jgi:hypothetical protein
METSILTPQELIEARKVRYEAQYGIIMRKYRKLINERLTSSEESEVEIDIQINNNMEVTSLEFIKYELEVTGYRVNMDNGAYRRTLTISLGGKTEN